MAVNIFGIAVVIIIPLQELFKLLKSSILHVLMQRVENLSFFVWDAAGS